MKSKTNIKQNQTNIKTKVIVGLIAIMCVFMSDGCQDASSVTRIQASLQNRFVSNDKVQAMTDFSDDNSEVFIDQQDTPRIDSESCVKKIMSTYENSDIPRLQTGINRERYQNTICVPILRIVFN